MSLGIQARGQVGRLLSRRCRQAAHERELPPQAGCRPVGAGAEVGDQERHLGRPGSVEDDGGPVVRDLDGRSSPPQAQDPVVLLVTAGHPSAAHLEHGPADQGPTQRRRRLGGRDARRTVGVQDPAGLSPAVLDAGRRGEGQPAGTKPGHRCRPAPPAEVRPPLPHPPAARRPGRRLRSTPPDHQHRSVVVPRFIREDLGRQLAGKAPSDLVFGSRASTPLRVQNFRRDWFDRAADAVGLSGLTPHELRHTAASLAIASGASVKGVQSMLGHASAQMTLDRYGHLFPDELDAVADRLDAARADQVLTEPRPDALVARIRRAD
ncbi:tyrosine-type recombinase/integrase [Geodermatophilus maliterrae]|uniref:Tyrosine-type recombinase/integrase n=1 Tax=Geodermatophilus maliterrae TaxID=3162531 RepID=A0ABV3XPF7_9ACTN